MSDELTSALVSLFVVALVAALAPFIVALVPRLRVPQVVVLIVGGIIIGPQGYASGRAKKHRAAVQRRPGVHLSPRRL
jgi:Kef-type K+ transport system membrane component KefB